MNAPVAKIPGAARVVAAIDVLEIRAQIRAFLWREYQLELQEDVDELQAYAERSGLVREIGQDRVQEIMAAPFARYREMIEPDDGPTSRRGVQCNVAGTIRQALALIGAVRAGLCPVLSRASWDRGLCCHRTCATGQGVRMAAA
jgi:hypothetical protein